MSKNVKKAQSDPKNPRTAQATRPSNKGGRTPKMNSTRQDVPKAKSKAKTNGLAPC